MSAALSVKRTRVCIITPTHWKAFMGGAQYQVRCILDALIPLNRYEFHYLARRVAPGYQPGEYRILPISKSRRPPRFGYLLADALPLYRALCEIQPDVIYQRVGCGYTGIAAYYAQRHGARLVWHVAHDTDVTRGVTLDTQSNFIWRFFEKRAIEYGIRHADRIVVQTEHQAKLLKEHYGRAAQAVVPNFQPLPTETIDKSGPPLVVWIANLKSWKQPEVFVRLAARLSDLKDVRFVMVGAVQAGPREQEWRDSLMRGIEAAENLEYVGESSQDDVNRLLARAHVFVNTSLHEGFANTFIQAWARAVPVVSLHANPDGVFDREMIGMHAETEDRLAEAVRILTTDAEKRAAFASRAQEYARLHHSPRNADLLAQLFD